MESPRVQNLIEQLRDQCLHRGIGGIKQLGAFFRFMDSDFSKRVCFREFSEGLGKFDLRINEDDLKLLFSAFDKDKNGQIDFVELLSKLRPPMPPCRVNVINEAFDKLDAIRDGAIKMDDLKIVYSANARKHPKFLSGEWTEEQTLRNFLDSIDTPGNPDGKVTREEFMNYYAGVSSTVDDDSYFDLMMRACYDLPQKGQAKK